LFFRLHGTANGRRVWRHEARSNYIYFWDWGVNSGQEWMVGHSPDSPVRGIRSTNMEGSGRGDVCVTDVTERWMVLTETEEWLPDDTFSLQCS
jgi:hypothetical protein